MIDPSKGKRILQGLPSTTGDGSEWTPLPAREFAAELARTHPHYEIDLSQKPMPGGMGAVYRARDNRDGRKVAIKALRPDRVDHGAFLDRFKREIEMLKGLDHPNVVKIHDWGETDKATPDTSGTPFFVMEWLDGQTLKQLLASPAQLTHRRKLELMAGICEGVKYIHQQGIIHRDLKAQNIMIVAADGRPVVLDFGVARDVSQGTSAVSLEYGTPGTDSHMAPELFLNPPVVKPCADVYSLGIVFLEIVTGGLPKPGHPKPSDFGFPQALDAVVERALNHNHAVADRRQSRYQTVAEFADEIKRAAESVPQAARPVEPPHAPHPPTNKDNMPAARIQFRDSQSSFRPAKRLRDEDWIDSSFSQSPQAIGRLRLPAVNNGRYESKHPILDEHGAAVGFMVDGVSSIGYTFTCVYAGHCFWITHQTFGSTFHGGGSTVSLVGEAGSFWFSSKGTKFRAVKSFGFDRSWLDTIRVFKLLDDGAYLLYLTNYGFCLFDTRMRDIVAKAEFANLAYQWSGFALSPKVKLLAIGCSERGDKNPVDGEYRYKNFVRIYNLETGGGVGEQALPGDRQMRWTIDFSEDGRQLRAASDSSTHVFELSANP